MILITGAGGKTGRALVQELSKAEKVSAFVHREEQGSLVRSLGAERVTVGDLRDESSIRSAMHGVRAVYHMYPNMSPDEIEVSHFVIRAARESGVEHFAYHSVLHPQTQRMTHHWQKLRVEEMIFESAIPFTILQPAPYMQNLLAGWKSIVEENVLRVPYSVHSKFSFIDLADLAEAAKIVLTEPGHKNAIYELAGTQPMSHLEIAQLLSLAFERDVRAEHQEMEDWRSQAKGLSAYAMENLVRMFAYYDQWGLIGNQNLLRWILKRDPTTLEGFIQRTLDERGANH